MDDLIGDSGKVTRRRPDQCYLCRGVAYDNAQPVSSTIRRARLYEDFIAQTRSLAARGQIIVEGRTVRMA